MLHPPLPNSAILDVCTLRSGSGPVLLLRPLCGNSHWLRFESNTVKSLPLYDLLFAFAVEHMANVHTSKTGQKLCIWVAADTPPCIYCFDQSRPLDTKRWRLEIQYLWCHWFLEVSQILFEGTHWCVPQHALNSIR